MAAPIGHIHLAIRESTPAFSRQSTVTGVVTVLQGQRWHINSNAYRLTTSNGSNDNNNDNEEDNDEQDDDDEYDDVDADGDERKSAKKPTVTKE